MKPLLKWPGGKRWAIASIQKLLPSAYDCFYEPFFGGGALFFSERPTKAFLSDINPDLINCYNCLDSDSDRVWTIFSDFDSGLESYLSVRSSNPTDDFERAARLIFLTRNLFNGLYRVNAKGDFNVPYGYRTIKSVLSVENLREYANVLRHAKILCVDFEEAVSAAKAGDFVYFDPPYKALSSPGSFQRYTPMAFSDSDQVRLANCAKDLVRRGVFVLVSNPDCALVRGLYSDFQVTSLVRHSRISSDKKFRSQITELLFRP